ncbi:unnamed protein product [Owenia fusiformis]|uniref:Sushi domain-containing protein n=1 Tax=Owenia fusiformis TaxID=6347 RepID=A0A8S4Q0H2_OWEFU|nr:unnamed protein product [Owenia fusiformis]
MMSLIHYLGLVLLIYIREVRCALDDITFCSNSVTCEGPNSHTCSDDYPEGYEVCHCGEFLVGMNCDEKVSYYLVDKDLLYAEGENYCESAGLGKMAVILSAQHSLVAEHVLDGKDAFVGGRIVPLESNTWDDGMWLDYSPVSTWVDWSDDLKPETEKAIYMLRAGGWQGKKLSDKKRILCQKIYTCNGVPPDVSYATKTLSTINTYSKTYEYQCDIGYRFDALNNDFQYIRCRGEIWQTPLPCYIKDCGSPPPDSNAQLTFTNTTYGSSVNYACRVGYSSMGYLSRNITCLVTSVWESYTPCEPLSCGQPPLDYMSTVDSDNTSIADISNVPKELTIYNTNLTYTCSAGYGINGSSTIVQNTIRCMADGEWEVHIYCSHKYCGLPEVDNNATQIGTATEFASNVTFICLPGYLVGGDGGAPSYVVACDSNGLWTSHAQCFKTSCPGAYDSDSNANITVLGNLFEDIVRYDCLSGYLISGNGSQSEDVQCQSDRTWSNHTQCMARSCGYPVNDSNAMFSYIEGRYGDYITYTCYTGHILAMNQIISENITCREDGTWSAHQHCFKLSCGEPWSDPYATINVTDFDYTYESNVTYTCVVGYGIGYDGPSEETITCLDTAYWSPHTHCVRAPCDAPPVDTNANVTYTSTTYMGVANYACNVGYRISRNGSQAESIVCGADGNWSSHTACLEISCGTPVDDSFANVSWTSELYLSNTTYDCLYGYVTLNGSHSEVTRCFADGNWSTHTPCERISCGVPITDSNSNLTLSDNLYESNVTYTCNYGFSVGGSNELFDVIYCEGDGNWSTHSTCQRISCGNPPVDSNSTMDSIDNLFESVVSYTCNTGFYIGNTSNQSENITCQGNGSWTSHTFCEKIACGIPVSDPNAILTIGDNLYGSNTTYTCHDGFLTAGAQEEIISCQADGNWTNHAGCQRVSCGSPIVDANAVMTTSDNLYQSNVIYTCNTGYLIGGMTGQSESITCGHNGSWTIHTQCMKISCGNPPVDSNSNTSSSDNLYGANITYTCDTGHLIGGVSDEEETITCQENGNWTDHTMCLPISCGNPPVDNNSTLTPANNLFGSNVTYICNSGYLIGGITYSQDVITCQSNGSWTLHTPCVRLACGNPIVDPKATMFTTDNLFESNTIYNCSDGYLIGGNGDASETITCQEDGDWSNHTMCLPISCGSPITDVHSNMTTGENLYGSNITYTCDVGYLIGGTLMNEETIYCDSYGHWTNHSLCEIISCGQPPIDTNANSTVGDNTFGSVVVYKCFEGHILNDTNNKEDNVTCTIDGNWTAHTPCVPISCGSINISQNVTVTFDSLIYNAMANFLCSIGFVSLSSGSSSGTIKCLSNGTWSEDIQCIPVSCGSPPIDQNSNVTYVDTVYNSKAMYECHPGTLTQGASNDSIICQSDATWSKHVNCTSVFCGPNPPDPYADILLLNNSTKDEALYTCKPGSALLNGAVSNNITCLATGTWSSRDSCFPISCQNPPEDVNANVTRSFFDEKHLVTYKCITNYYIGGTGNDSETISCSDAEDWGIHTPCSFGDCGSWPVDMRASIVQSSGTLLYSAVHYECHEGYTLTGEDDGSKNKMSTCLPERKWTPVPYCEGVSEPEYKRAKKIEFPPEEAKHAVVVGSSALLIVIAFVVLIVVLDVPKVVKDLRYKMYTNLKAMIYSDRGGSKY